MQFLFDTVNIIKVIIRNFTVNNEVRNDILAAHVFGIMVIFGLTVFIFSAFWFWPNVPKFSTQISAQLNFILLKFVKNIKICSRNFGELFLIKYLCHG